MDNLIYVLEVSAEDIVCDIRVNDVNVYFAHAREHRTIQIGVSRHFNSGLNKIDVYARALTM